MTTTAEIVANSAAKAAGLTLTESGRSNIVEMIQTGASFKPGQEVEITIDGNAMPITQWLAGLAKSAPSYFKSAGSTSTPSVPPAGGNMTERFKAMRAAENRPERLRQEAADLAEKHGNPYQTNNLTHRFFIEKNNPALAAKLRARAGVRRK